MNIFEDYERTFEDRYKEILLNAINKMNSKQVEVIEQIKKTIRDTDIDIDEDIPNMAITLNNRLVELSHIFKNEGISIFSKDVSETIYMPSDIGDAIIEDMFDKVIIGIEMLERYSTTLSDFVKKKQEDRQILKEAGSIKKLFFKIRGYIIPNKKINFAYTQDEKKEIHSYLLAYKEEDKKIREYNLRDNIVPSLVKYISKRGYEGILEECIIPDMQKLGLEDLIPKLKEELSKEIEKDNIQASYPTTKCGELSPIQKEQIQRSSQQVVKKYQQNSKMKCTKNISKNR